MTPQEPTMITIISSIVTAILGFFGGMTIENYRVNKQKNIKMKSGNNSNQNVAGGNINIKR